MTICSGKSNMADPTPIFTVLAYLALGALGIVGTLVGVHRGAQLAENSALERERRAKEEQRASVRTLLRLEIEENIKGIWQTLDLASRAEAAESLVNLRPDSVIGSARKLAELPSAEWSFLAWESQLAKVTAALDSTEVRAVHEFYAGLNRLSAIRASAQAVCTDLYGDQSRFLMVGGQLNRHAIQELALKLEPQLPELWNDYREESQRLMKLSEDLVKHLS
jgi:hypothetical protein